MAPNSRPPRPLIVVIGLGKAGTVLARSLSKQRAVRLGLASSRPAHAHALAAELAADAVYSSYDAPFDDDAVAAVVIVTPTATHPHFLAAAANAGKHIFCEKPLGASVVAIERALAAVSAAGVRLMVGFMRRWDVGFAAAKAAVADGQLGNVVLLKCTSGDAYYPEMFADDHISIVREMSVHDIDLVRWLSSADVVRVYTIVDGINNADLRAAHKGDFCVAVLELSSGARAMLHTSLSLGYGCNVTTEIVGNSASMRVGDMHDVPVQKLSAAQTTLSISEDYRVRFADAFDAEMAAFVRLVLADDDGAQRMLAEDSRYASGDDALRATIIAEAMVRSSETKVPQEVSLTLARENGAETA